MLEFSEETVRKVFSEMSTDDLVAFRTHLENQLPPSIIVETVDNANAMRAALFNRQFKILLIDQELGKRQV